jgi:hypothetical protein
MLTKMREFNVNNAGVSLTQLALASREVRPPEVLLVPRPLGQPIEEGGQEEQAGGRRRRKTPTRASRT